jgi:hypothetical protein
MSAKVHRIATESAHMAQRLASNLLLATQARASEADRLNSMTQAFAIWPKLCRHVAELEDMAPRTSNVGRDQDDEFQERLSGFNARRVLASNG